ncbi:uncharacterized protein LOC114359516 [Ostrinia furnacalis]|uniref:uncharacterized protein LOC114359516 n=1 Tax=Ostrinia furnacalis TaxID=93504 RepID=UPI00103B35D7|nr:uncharacterized protein LOC114359516 [Ostrinia furnacalis]
MLPRALVHLLRLDLLEFLPTHLLVLGSILCLATLIGCCGAILKGNVGKWLLVMYTIELTIFVVLNIFIAVVMHLGHQKTSRSGPVASALTMDPTAGVDLLNAGYIQEPDHLDVNADDQPILTRRFPRGILDNVKHFAGNTVNKAGSIIGDSTNAVKSSLKDVAGNIKDKVDSSIQAGKEGYQAISEATGIMKDAGKFFLSLFSKLDTQEEEAVQWVRPILGMYTQPVFRLTHSSFVMSVWAGVIGVEIVYILLSVYLCTTKNLYYEGIPYDGYVQRP